MLCILFILHNIFNSITTILRSHKTWKLVSFFSISWIIGFLIYTRLFFPSRIEGRENVKWFDHSKYIINLQAKRAGEFHLWLSCITCSSPEIWVISFLHQINIFSIYHLSYVLLQYSPFFLVRASEMFLTYKKH